MKNNELIDLIYKVLLNEATVEERKQLSQLIENDDHTRTLYHKHVAIYRSLNPNIDKFNIKSSLFTGF